jgi:hypothetical protein
MRRIILSSVVCPAVQYFSTLLHKRNRCYGIYKVCFDFLYNFCLKHLSLYEFGEILSYKGPQ